METSARGRSSAACRSRPGARPLSQWMSRLRMFSPAEVAYQLGGRGVPSLHLPQDDEAAALEGQVAAGLAYLVLGFDLARRRVDHPRPRLPEGPVRQDVLQRLVMRVEEHQEAVVDDALAAGAQAGDGLTVEKHHEQLVVAGQPVVVAHRLAVGREPLDV